MPNSGYLLICARTGVGHSANTRCSHIRSYSRVRPPPRAVVHRRAEAGGAECERIKLRTASLPSSTLHRLCPPTAVAVLFVL